MGGVFINYRADDQPVAAAAIYEDLVKRFGARRVFRDCVSMEPGENYTASLRKNLESADVLVAVIGPQWLKLADPATGERLIDQDNDWVRWEIARAFERNIPVVPVRLRDTPADAPRIRREDLPENIRKLARLQALDMSQRRLGEDFNRLATRLEELLRRSPGINRSGLRWVVTAGADDARLPFGIRPRFVAYALVALAFLVAAVVVALATGRDSPRVITSETIAYGDITVRLELHADGAGRMYAECWLEHGTQLRTIRACNIFTPQQATWTERIEPGFPSWSLRATARSTSLSCSALPPVGHVGTLFDLKDAGSRISVAGRDHPLAC